MGIVYKIQNVSFLLDFYFSYMFTNIFRFTDDLTRLSWFYNASDTDILLQRD